jgi:plastocyanin
MNPLLALAAAIAAALLWRRLRRPRHGAAPKRLDVAIILGGNPHNPTVQTCPDLVVAAPGDQVRWTIHDPNATNAEVWLRGFKLKGSGTPNDPFDGPEANRKSRTLIKDKVKGGALKEKYEYMVFLNGAPAADPDILIKEI